MSFEWGVCFDCGDIIGPWTLYKGRWLCDSCYEGEKNEKGDSKGFDCDKTKRIKSAGDEPKKTMGRRVNGSS